MHFFKYDRLNEIKCIQIVNNKICYDFWSADYFDDLSYWNVKNKIKIINIWILIQWLTERPFLIFLFEHRCQ